MASLGAGASAALPHTKNQVIVLAGATAVGKSAVARHLCRTLGNCEIVLADSVQIYRHLDIGSNKPSAEEMRETPHHMVDICDPHDAYSCGDFVKQAAPIIRDILARGKVPVVVGGSTMWLQWLVHGVPDAPKPDPEVVKEAEALLADASERADWDAAVEVARPFDPERVGRLGRNDWYRLQRYLEVGLSLRRGAGASEGAGSGGGSGGGKDSPRVGVTGQRTKPLADLDLRCFFLSESREQLYHTIDSRCQDMLRAGLVREVRDLLLEEQLTPAAVPARASGYRQTIEYLQALAAADDASGGLGKVAAAAQGSGSLSVAAFSEFVRLFCTATRNYAKRQFQWYRRDKAFLWTRITRPGLDTAAAAKTASSAGEAASAPDPAEPYARAAAELLHWCSQPQSNFGQAIKHQLQRSASVAAIRSRMHHGHRMKVAGSVHDWIAVAALVHSGELRPPALHAGMTAAEVAESWATGFDASTAAERACAPFGDDVADVDLADDSGGEGGGGGSGGGGSGGGGGGGESGGALGGAGSASAAAAARRAPSPSPAPDSQQAQAQAQFPRQLTLTLGPLSAHDALIRSPEGAGGGKSKSPTARALRSYQSRFRLGGEAAAEAGVVGGADLDAVIREASEASRELRERHPMLLAEFAAEWALGRTEAEGDD